MKQYEFTDVEITSSWGKWEKNDGGFIISWGCKNVGFGELTFFSKDGKTHCDSEAMGKEFIKQALAHLTDTIILK